MEFKFKRQEFQINAAHLWLTYQNGNCANSRIYRDQHETDFEE